MAIKQIVKREGDIVDFDQSKITDAIFKAMKAVRGEKASYDDALKVSYHVGGKLQVMFPNGINPWIEQVQNVVEMQLMEDDPETAKAYILYREQHNKIREIGGNLEGLIKTYLGKKDWMVKGNANVTFSLQGMNNYVTETVSSKYWLNTIYPFEIKKAHNDADLHLHDLGIIATYCVGWDLEDFLREGMTGVPGKTASKPPRHFSAALGQLVNLFFTLQGESAGAQAVSNFDTLIAPFIRYDHLNYEQVKQELQEFLFNMNVSTRVGGQTPFTNVTLDLKVPELFKDKAVIRGGELTDDAYGDFQKEMDMFNRAFAEIMLEGDANHRVHTFPIPTYNITKDFDWDNSNLDLIWEMTAKYGSPYFANYVNSDMNAEDARSMCCRLRIDNRQLVKRGGGLFGSNPLTGSLGVVTLNMPRLAYKSEKNEEKFFQGLEKLMDLAKESLEIKRKVLENDIQNDGSLYPYSRFYLRDIEAQTHKYWANHFSTIGLVGMNEAIRNLMPGENIGTENGREFAKRALDFMREKLVRYQEETGNNYNLEATPAEGATYRLAKKDREDFPDIIFANDKAVKENGAKPFYTNSTQLPVDYTDDIFEVLDSQEELQAKYTGGTVVHIFAGERLRGQDVKNLVRTVTERYKIPYFTITPTFSICTKDGYLPGEQQKCPQCDGETEVYSRVVGYLRPVNQWNEGKQAEWQERKMFKIPASEDAAAE